MEPLNKIKYDTEGGKGMEILKKNKLDVNPRPN